MTATVDNKEIPPKIVRRQAEIIVEALEKLAPIVFEKGRPADECLGRHFKDHREFGSRDRRFVGEAFFSFFRWYGWTSAAKLDHARAAAVSWCLDNSEIHPAIDLLISDNSLPAALKELSTLPLSEKAAKLSGWFGAELVPQMLVPDWTFRQTDTDPEKFIESSLQRPPTWIRIRPGKTDKVKAALDKLEIPWTSPETMPDAVALPPGTSLHKLRAAAGQTFEVQDIASQCVGLVCNPRGGEWWWDACAGAGGKTLHLADLLKQNGRIFAGDIRPAAVQELKKRARKNGIKCINASIMNADEEPVYDCQFNGILIDAPCSGLGTWSRNPDMRWRTHEHTIAAKARLQLNILQESSAALKPGGKLIYSVCTLTKKETGELVSAFLESCPEMKPEPCVNPLTGEQTDGIVQINLWDGPGGGMYIAHFRKEE